MGLSPFHVNIFNLENVSGGSFACWKEVDKINEISERYGLIPRTPSRELSRTFQDSTCHVSWLKTEHN